MPPKPSYETDNLALAPPSQDPGTVWDGPRAVKGSIWDRFDWFDGWPVLHLAQESINACFHSFRAWKVLRFYGRLATSSASASLRPFLPSRLEGCWWVCWWACIGTRLKHGAVCAMRLGSNVGGNGEYRMTKTRSLIQSTSNATMLSASFNAICFGSSIYRNQ